MSTSKQTNRLIHEKSPYLLQHAYNPVDWYPWGEEAFNKAKAEDKPIFLSIGYSTCHWCHVMERESFEDQEVADYLNAYFISIKVDREERPDIDNIYMSFCQATTGSGGWPLTVFLTPDKLPFFAGTYFPKESRHGYTGLLDLLDIINNKWHENRQELMNSAKNIARILYENELDSMHKDFNPKVFKEVYEILKTNFDSKYGGFSRAPKFPTPHNLMYLLRYYKAYGNKEALNMVESTLEHMYRGGIFDHLGGGFSRYSTDSKWLVPHFEKMLYDNALLIMIYCECYQLTKNPFYKSVAEKVIAYIMRDMTSEKGGFFSAEDADSEGQEGKFYVWTDDEIREILDEEDAQLFISYYQVTKKGNFEGKNILNLIGTSLEKMESNPELMTQLMLSSNKLFEVRKQRIPPYKDDKILTSWNGLMIVALAMAGRIFDNDEIHNCAKNAYEFITTNMVDENGRLYARYRDGEKKHLGYLDDYAFMIWACIELYEAEFDLKYLKQAVKFTGAMLDLFGDESGNGLYFYGKDSEQLLTRPKELYDGAIPSGNSVAAYNLLRLAKLTGNQLYEEYALNMISYFVKMLEDSPTMYTFMLMACLFNHQKGQEIVLAGSQNDTHLDEMKRVVTEPFLPFSVVLINNNPEQLKEVNEFASQQAPINGKATAYVCENFTCKKPIHDVEKLKEAIRS